MTGDQSAGTGSRGMRLPFRMLWFLAYHALLLWGVVQASNRAGRETGFGLTVLGFGIGLVLMLQASAKLPAFYHGISLFVLLPGLIFLGPIALAPLYENAVMSPQEVTVLSQSSHSVSNITSFAGAGRRFSYTDVRVRMSDGAVRDGIIRPARDAPVGSALRMRVDPLHLVRPQLNADSSPPAVIALLTIVLAALAELELVSALLRAEGASFIAESGRRGGSSGEGSGSSSPVESPRRL